jgi:hypothetical protein
MFTVEPQLSNYKLMTIAIYVISYFLSKFNTPYMHVSKHHESYFSTYQWKALDTEYHDACNYVTTDFSYCCWFARAEQYTYRIWILPVVCLRVWNALFNSSLQLTGHCHFITVLALFLPFIAPAPGRHNAQGGTVHDDTVKNKGEKVIVVCLSNMHACLVVSQ